MKSQKELQWKSRRGMKELDILFEHYLFEHYPQADDVHKLAFEAIAEMQDPKITDYLFERDTPTSPAVVDIINIMRDYSQKKTTG